jgi:hypothetical protein
MVAEQEPPSGTSLNADCGREHPITHPSCNVACGAGLHRELQWCDHPLYEVVAFLEALGGTSPGTMRHSRGRRRVEIVGAEPAYEPPPHDGCPVHRYPMVLVFRWLDEEGGR